MLTISKALPRGSRPTGEGCLHVRVTVLPRPGRRLPLWRCDECGYVGEYRQDHRQDHRQ